MAELKTRPTKASVAAFLSAVEDEQRRSDAKAVDKLMREVTGKKPVMWGGAIVGYDSYQSRSGDWPIIGFSPRKAALTLYVMPGLKAHAPLLKKIGKHKATGGCLYIGKLTDIDQNVLRELLTRSVKYMREEYQPN